MSDDASTDGVRELLAEFHDDRFKYFRNDKNLGAHKNWLKSLELGRGEWVYLVMGRDKLNAENIGRLIDLLTEAEENNALYLRDIPFNNRNKFYYGIDAMIKFIDYIHPTGEIFRRSALMAVPERGRYFSLADMYPENYVIRDLLLKGRGAFIHSGVNAGDTVTDYQKVVSKVEYAVAIEKAYFAPPRRLIQFYEQIDMIDDLPAGIFTGHELNKFFKHRYYAVLMYVSYMFRIWCKDPVQMGHYCQPVRYISFYDMFKNILRAYSETTRHLREKGRYTFSRNLIMLLCTVKAVIIVPVKLAAVSVLKPLGIWKKLRSLKYLLV